MFLNFFIILFLKIIHLKYTKNSEIDIIKIPKIIETKIYEGENEYLNEIHEISLNQSSNMLISVKNFEVK